MGLLDPDRRPRIVTEPERCPTNGQVAAAVAPLPTPEPAPPVRLVPDPPADAPAGDEPEVVRLRRLLHDFAQCLPQVEGEVRRFVEGDRIFGVFVYNHEFKAAGVREVVAVHELTPAGSELARKGTVIGTRTHTSSWEDPLFRRAVAEVLAAMEMRR